MNLKSPRKILHVYDGVRDVCFTFLNACLACENFEGVLQLPCGSTFSRLFFDSLKVYRQIVKIIKHKLKYPTLITGGQQMTTLETSHQKCFTTTFLNCTSDSCASPGRQVIFKGRNDVISFKL
jgi:hypothetical protein